MNPEKFNLPQVEIGNMFDFVMFNERMKSFFKYLQKELENEGPEIVSLVISIIENGHLTNIRNKLNERYDVLEEESERLMNSPESKNQDTVAKRTQIRQELNEVLEIQEQINKQLQENEIGTLSFRVNNPEDKKKAEKIAESILEKLRITVRPEYELN